AKVATKTPAKVATKTPAKVATKTPAKVATKAPAKVATKKVKIKAAQPLATTLPTPSSDQQVEAPAVHGDLKEAQMAATVARMQAAAAASAEVNPQSSATADL